MIADYTIKNPTNAKIEEIFDKTETKSNLYTLEIKKVEFFSSYRGY